MKLKKGSLEAKRFMAKIRAMKSGEKKKSIGATKFVEKKEVKSTKPKRTLQITRRTDGTFKKFKQIGATKFVEKKESKSTKPKRTLQITRRTDGTFKKFKQISGLHKDTKSHNVRISVVSGVKTQAMNDLRNWIKTLEICENKLAVAKDNVKRKHNENFYKIVVKKEMANIRSCKRHILSLKKHI